MADEKDAWIENGILKWVARVILPTAMTAALGFAGVYVKESAVAQRATTHAIDVLMGNQDRMNDHVSAEVSKVREIMNERAGRIDEGFRRFDGVLADHETRIRSIERR